MVTRGPGRRLTQIQATSRPDYLWLEVWSNMSKAAQRKEKKYWAIQKPKLDNACQLRGIYQIDPDDMEFKNTMNNARKKLEVPLESAMPCKIVNRHGETRSTQNNSHKTRYACIIEAHDLRDRACSRLNAKIMKIFMLRRSSIQ